MVENAQWPKMFRKCVNRISPKTKRSWGRWNDHFLFIKTTKHSRYITILSPCPPAHFCSSHAQTSPLQWPPEKDAGNCFPQNRKMKGPGNNKTIPDPRKYMKILFWTITPWMKHGSNETCPTNCVQPKLNNPWPRTGRSVRRTEAGCSPYANRLERENETPVPSCHRAKSTSLDSATRTTTFEKRSSQVSASFSHFNHVKFWGCKKAG